MSFPSMENEVLLMHKSVNDFLFNFVNHDEVLNKTDRNYLRNYITEIYMKGFARGADFVIGLNSNIASAINADLKDFK